MSDCIFLLFLRGQFEISLTKGGIKSCIYEGTMPLFTLYMKDSLCCCLLFDKVVHPHSLNKFSNDTDLVKPVTRRAASFWIFCNVCESCPEREGDRRKNGIHQNTPPKFDSSEEISSSRERATIPPV